MKLLNMPAPSFTLKDQRGMEHSLSDYLGHMILLYFYPKDMTPGCTIEAQQFRDLHDAFTAQNIVVLGISADSVAKHKQFVEKECLPFTLLSDEDKTVAHLYGVWVEKSMYGKTYMGIQRDSFLIDTHGVIIKHYNKVHPRTHAQMVLDDVVSMAS